MTTADFAPGDILEFTEKYSHGVEKRTCIVTAVNDPRNAPGWVTFIGHHVDERMTTGCGAFKPEDVGTKAYGIIEVKKIGKGKLFGETHWTPQPGNPHYDLMC